jgi:hypothetical protein
MAYRTRSPDHVARYKKRLLSRLYEVKSLILCNEAHLIGETGAQNRESVIRNLAWFNNERERLEYKLTRVNSDLNGDAPEDDETNAVAYRQA